MLEELRIRGLGVIDDAVLDLGPGLTVVSGETGAGKTMVVSGLLLLFGGRADTARLRTGVDQASVEGRLTVLDTVAVARVREAGGEFDDDTGLFLRRTVSAGGRSRAYVGGAGAPVAVLAELAERLMTVHGQSDQLRLTRRTEQLDMLDRSAGIDSAAFAAAFGRWRAASDALHERTAKAAQLRREAELLEHGITEIDEIQPMPGEDVELEVLARRLAHADALRLAAHAAHDALAGNPDESAVATHDAGALVGAARRSLAAQGDADAELDELAVRAGEIAVLIADLAADLRDYAERLDSDPARLAQIEDRRSALRALVRKYGDSGSDADAVLRWAAQARQRLTDIDVSDDAIATLRAGRDAAAMAAAQEADRLTSARSSAAQLLSAQVSEELGGLAMAAATVRIEVRPRPPGQGVHALPDGANLGPDGGDDVEFLLRSHPGAPELPIARGASGGELSRVMLAVEVCLAGADAVPTLVFDEVDAGVGGRAAAEVGRRLARLARDHQVIVVTHLAQVAAFADTHIVVDKSGSSVAGTVTASDVHHVTGAARVAELARMLAGTDTPAAREHAQELLAGAAADRERFSPRGAGKPRRPKSQP